MKKKATKPDPGLDYGNLKDDTKTVSDVTARLNKEVENLVLAAKKIASCEETLKKAQTAYNDISDHRIPELMEEAGYEEGGKHVVREGLVVKWVRAIRTSITAAKKTEAFAWLNDNGHGGMIKRHFIIKFGRDDEKWARKFARDLAQRKKPVVCERKDKVEPSTLKSFVKEQLESGADFPLETFSVHLMPTTKIV